MTKASDNVFPRLLISEGGSTTTPASGNVTVYAKADGLLYSKDDAGSETALGGSAGLTDPMTTRGDVIVRNAANTTARLAVGAAGKFLTSDGTDIAYGQGPLTTTGDLLIGATGGTPTRLAAGATSGHVLTSNGSGAAPSWQAAAGGGATHSYVGYNTIGASNEAPTKQTQSYFKEFTPGSSGMLLSIGVYIDQTAIDAYVSLTVALNADNAGSPGQLLAWNGSSNNDGNQVVFEKNSSGVGDPGWVHMPISYYCTGSTKYWLQVLFLNSGGTIHIYYDTSGSDPTNANGGANAPADGRRYTLSNSTKSYSIRGDYLA